MGERKISNQSDLASSIEVRSYMAEMHNDGLYFLEQARLTEDVFVKRRFLRASIIYLCSSVEAAISKIVYGKIMQTEYEDGHNYDRLKTSLNDPNSIPPRFFRSIDGKIEVLEDLFETTIPQQIKSRYKNLTLLRNKIIHFSVSYTNEVYATGEIERVANEAPEIVDEILSVMFGCIDLFDGFFKNRSSNY